MKEFKEGDKVVRFGRTGVVIGVDPDDTIARPVYVEFDNWECDSFTVDGECYLGCGQSLFHADNED